MCKLASQLATLVEGVLSTSSQSQRPCGPLSQLGSRTAPSPLLCMALGWMLISQSWSPVCHPAHQQQKGSLPHRKREHCSQGAPQMETKVLLPKKESGPGCTNSSCPWQALGLHCSLGRRHPPRRLPRTARFFSAVLLETQD